MIEAQSLDLLSEPLVIPSPLQPLQTQLAAVPAQAPLTVSTGLTGLSPSLTPTIGAPAPAQAGLKVVPTSRRFLGPGLTRMHPYYYVQYVPLDLKQNLVSASLESFVTFLLFHSKKNGLSRMKEYTDTC